MSAFANLPIYMDVAEFLAWDSGDDLRYELVDGVPRSMAPTSTTHGVLQSELCRLIGNHLLDRGSGCDVVANPGVIPRLLSAHNVRIPDVGVTCVPMVPGQATMTDPVLLVEILSPSNQAKTWSNVWAYTSISSLHEILVLHTSRIFAKLLRRDAEGQWPGEPAEYRHGELDLASIDFRVALEDLYRRTGLPRAP